MKVIILESIYDHQKGYFWIDQIEETEKALCLLFSVKNVFRDKLYTRLVWIPKSAIHEYSAKQIVIRSWVLKPIGKLINDLPEWDNPDRLNIWEG
jgi:hypothetical protein